MALQQYTPITFNNVAVDGSGNMKLFFQDEDSPLGTRKIQAVVASVVGVGDIDQRGQPMSSIWVGRVKLTNFQESDVQAMYKVFNEQKGTAFLRANDSASVTWRVEARVLGTMRAPGAKNLYYVVFAVANPYWEADNPDSGALAAQLVSPLNITITTAGIRKAYPLFSFTINAGKLGTISDYGFVYQSFVVNRTLFDWSNLPIALSDVQGSASKLTTDSSATGATVKQTTGATTITVNIAAAATTIDLTAGGSWPATGGMGYITDTRGNTFHDQFAYTLRVGNQLQGVTWFAATASGGTSNPGAAAITAGGIAHTIAQVSSIQPSGVQLSGNDCRVWVDDQQVTRFLNNWNTTTTEIWANLTLPGAIPLTLVTAMTSSFPATGGSIAFLEGVTRLGDTGFIAFCVAGVEEIVYYSGRDVASSSITGIVRGCWGTVAAAHAVTAGTVFPNPARIFVAAGNAISGNPPSVVSTRPCIQLDASSNKIWKWSNSSDISSIYYDPTFPDRTAQWAPGYDDDGNSVYPLMSLSASSTLVTFKDDAPGDGNPPYNFLGINLPQGIKPADVNAIKNDWTPTEAVINLELWTSDSQGTPKRQDQLQQSGAAAARVLPAVLAASAYRIKFKGRYNIVTGFRGLDSLTQYKLFDWTSVTADTAGWIGVRFTIEQDTVIPYFLMELAKDTAGSISVFGYIRPEASGLPDVSVLRNRTIYPVDPSTGVGAPLVVSGTTGTLYRFHLPYRGVVKAGTYWITLGISAAAGVSGRIFGAIYGRQGPTSFAKWAGGAYGFDPDFSPWVYICCDYDNNLNAPIQIDQPLADLNNANARTGVTASIDNTEIIMNTAQYPWVHRQTAFVAPPTAGSLHHLSGTLKNLDTLDQIVIDKWAAYGSTFDVDCETQQVTYTEGTVPYSLMGCITPSNRTRWMTCEADPDVVGGANRYRYTDAALVTGSGGSLDLSISARASKV